MALGDGFESCLEAGEWLDTVEVASLDKVGNQTLRFGPTYLNSYDHFEGSKSLIYFTRICPPLEAVVSCGLYQWLLSGQSSSGDR